MASAAGLGIMVIAITVLFGGVVMVILLNWLRAHRLRVRDPTDKKQYLEDYWMIEKKDKQTGVMYWHAVFWQRKIKVEKPPKEARDIGKRGKIYAEAYRLSEDEFVWITDKGIKIEEDEDGKVTAVDVDTGETIDSFAPFTATQRQVLVNQYTKSREIGKPKWGAGEILNLMSVGSLVMVILLFILFGGDLLNEYHSVKNSQQQLQQVNADIMKANAAVAKALGARLDDLDIDFSQVGRQPDNAIITQPDESPPDYRELVGIE